MVRVYDLDKRSIQVICNEKPLERVFSFKYTNKTVKRCFSTFSTLNKLQRFSPIHMIKQLVQLLVLSKLDTAIHFFVTS